MLSYKRGYAQVNLDAIRENLIHMKEGMNPKSNIIAVLKADGYGHGSVAIAENIKDLEFISAIAVATVEEAHIIRMTGTTKPILVLGYTFPYCYEILAKEEITATVFREDSLKELEEAAVLAGKNIKIHIKVDTGMSRVGITPDEKGLLFLEKVLSYKHLELTGIFTHFARADEADKSSAKKQLSIFNDFVQKAESKYNVVIPIKHVSNSAGILEIPEANLNEVRAGISLYGIYPSKEIKGKFPLYPAMSLHSHIVYKKTIEKGQSISYGGTFTAKRQMEVATIPLGYGDGYPRSLSNKGEVLVHGQRAPILGRICMDQFIVDVTNIKDAKEGDLVTLLGTQGKESITVQELGDLSGRFPYEFVCDIGKRVPRVYVRNGTFWGQKDYYNDF
ncbi:alanine racemase [Lachnospiraceae bacterium OttesenSCG-928-D06]|nr:alanine racemase [Lachnospiraceae bacterium OttesenSCG-928-D06]